MVVRSRHVEVGGLAKAMPEQKGFRLDTHFVVWSGYGARTASLMRVLHTGFARRMQVSVAQPSSGGDTNLDLHQGDNLPAIKKGNLREALGRAGLCHTAIVGSKR